MTAEITTAKTPARVASKDPVINMLVSDSFKKQMSLALPKSLTADRLTRIVLTEFRKTPKLLSCDQPSLFGAVLQCAALGLEPGSALGHCYLLPFYDKDEQTYKCQLIIGYRGMIDLARRSGQIASLSAYCVHEKDDFRYELGLHPDVRHVPAPLADRGPVTYAYAVAVLKDGGVQFEVLSRAEIEAVRKSSRGKNSGSWVEHWEEMAKKTVIRRLFKYLPVSVEAARATEIDEKADRGEAVTEQDWIDSCFIDTGAEAAPVVEPEAKPAGSTLKDKLKAVTQAPPPAEAPEAPAA